MTGIDDLNAKLDALNAQVDASNAKTDAVLDILAAKAASGSVVTNADLLAAIGRVDAIAAKVSAETSREDAALAAEAAGPTVTETI